MADIGLIPLDHVTWAVKSDRTFSLQNSQFYWNLGKEKGRIQYIVMLLFMMRCCLIIKHWINLILVVFIRLIKIMMMLEHRYWKEMTRCKRNKYGCARAANSSAIFRRLPDFTAIFCHYTKHTKSSAFAAVWLKINFKDNNTPSVMSSCKKRGWVALERHF